MLYMVILPIRAASAQERTMKYSRLSALCIFSLLLAACASDPAAEPAMEDTIADVQVYIASEEVSDGRGRFREIFCSVLEERSDTLPDYRPCDEALRTTGPEQGATGAPVDMGVSVANYLMLLVPGLGWNCFEDLLDLDFTGLKHAASVGYEVRMVPVDGLSSTISNAKMIRDYIDALPPEDAGRPIILAGYSKGAPDILQAVVDYPDMSRRVKAVVSLAGAVHGSPLANDSEQADANMLTMVPGSTCEEDDGDNDAVASLRTDIREKWLAENPLPEHIRYYSIVTFPTEERISWGLKKSWLLLGDLDIRNDTQVIIFDQMIPGSTVAAVVNADHWAIAVPVERSHPIIGSTVINRNDYPREAFLEAILRYVEEDLGD
jgi:hypothetical protein